jgi:hypothetical protein
MVKIFVFQCCWPAFFYALGFTEEAIMVDKYGKSELVGGTMDAIGKVCTMQTARVDH